MDYQKTRVDEPWGSIPPKASFELVSGFFKVENFKGTLEMVDFKNLVKLFVNSSLSIICESP